jgi:hypothetical protein
MKYLLLLHAPGGVPTDQTTAEYEQLYLGYARANAAMAEAGVLLDCGPLYPPSASTTVRVRDGRTLITDGPAAELREQIGGFTLIDCDGLDDALRWAATLPAASVGWVEVRPVIRTSDPRVAAPAGDSPGATR